MSGEADNCAGSAFLKVRDLKLSSIENGFSP